MSGVISKLFCTSLCVVLLAGCGQVHTTEDVADVSGTTGEQAETGQNSGQRVQESNQDSESMTESGNLPAESESQQEELAETQDTTSSQATVQENRVVLSDTIYDDVLNPIGTILSREIMIYSESEPETEVFQFDMSWPEIDVSFDGADLINETMLAYVDYNEAMYTQDETWLSSFEGTRGSFSSSFEGFSYRDDHYISFIQSEYIYEGGAHGMPYWEPFTFHLQSGEQLDLTDVIGNSEEELKEIVTSYFAEMINTAPDEYWENAEQTVQESITLDSNFVLTTEGIQFYLLPYDIAPYAAGFPAVVVPYEEFDMKIVLEPFV